MTGPPTALPLYFADKRGPYQERVTLSVEDGNPGQAVALVEESKSRVLYDVLRSGRVRLDGALRPEERRRERTLENELVALNRRIESSAENSGLRVAREGKRRELEALQTTLYAAHPDLAFQRGAAPPLRPRR